MEFRLLYEGQLLSSAGGDKRTTEKHAIRKKLHPQLRRLWSINSNLRQLAEYSCTQLLLKENRQTTEQERFDLGIKCIGEKWSRGGYQLVPLVTEAHALRCSLDVLMLRPEEGRSILQGGDIDGKLKTLFDALRIPTNLQETGGIGPQEDEAPLFCLLEDDSLISEVRITTDQLLLRPNEREVKANDVFAVIHVKLNHKFPGTFDQFFA